jgi:hypothetical protein
MPHGEPRPWRGDGATRPGMFGASWQVLGTHVVSAREPRSSNVVATPARARSQGAIGPAGPPPMTITDSMSFRRDNTPASDTDTHDSL